MSLIDSFLTNIYTVQRKAKGRYIGGFYEAGPDEVLKVRGSLQPTSGKNLVFAEEGDRLKQLYKFYSDTPLIVLGTKPLQGSDRVVIDGDTYKVINQENWQGLKVDLPHYKIILAREPEQ